MKQAKNILLYFFMAILTSTNCYPRPDIRVSTYPAPSPWEQDYINKRLDTEKFTIYNFISTKKEIELLDKKTKPEPSSKEKVKNVNEDKNKKDNQISKTKEFKQLTKGLSYDDMPTIALVGSGGGMRANLAFLGTMRALQKMNLLNGIRYASTLSGSTWMLGSFLAWASKMHNNLDLGVFSEYVQSEAGEEILDGDDIKNADDIIGKIAIKIANGERVQPSDIWGMVVMHRLMSSFMGDEHDITFKDIRNLLNKTDHVPFPIFTAAITNIQNYQWLEVNPYTTGCGFLGGFTPTSYFESKFRNGRLRTAYPESGLGEFLGLFGSAYSVTSQDADKHTKSLPIAIVNNILKRISSLPLYSRIINIDLTKQRFLEARMNNFTYRMDGASLGSEETLSLVDAGMAFNLPFPPLFEMDRNVDIYIVCDASADDGEYPQLRQAALYAQQNNIQFPNVNFPKNYELETENGKFLFRIFKEENKPTIIYFKNPISHATIDFTYSEEEFNAIAGIMFELVTKAKQTIKTEITNKIGNCCPDSNWAGCAIFNNEYPENTASLGFIASIVHTVDWLLGSCIRSIKSIGCYIKS